MNSPVARTLWSSHRQDSQWIKVGGEACSGNISYLSEPFAPGFYIRGHKCHYLSHYLLGSCDLQLQVLSLLNHLQHYWRSVKGGCIDKNSGTLPHGQQVLRNAAPVLCPCHLYPPQPHRTRLQLERVGHL